jgi:hypothetical protein
MCPSTARGRRAGQHLLWTAPGPRRGPAAEGDDPELGRRRRSGRSSSTAEPSWNHRGCRRSSQCPWVGAPRSLSSYSRPSPDGIRSHCSWRNGDGVRVFVNMPGRRAGGAGRLGLRPAGNGPISRARRVNQPRAAVLPRRPSRPGRFPALVTKAGNQPHRAASFVAITLVGPYRPGQGSRQQRTLLS